MQRIEMKKCTVSQDFAYQVGGITAFITISIDNSECYLLIDVRIRLHILRAIDGHLGALLENLPNCSQTNPSPTRDCQQ